MGLDLTLLPFENNIHNVSFTVLSLHRDYDLFGKIKSLSSMDVDNDFHSYVSRDDAYEESHFGDTTIDCYGKRVKFVLAKDLKLVDIPDATGAYVNALSDRTKIALFWH